MDYERFTFMHDSILAYISSCLDRDKYTVYVDLEGSQTTAGGTMAPEATVTNLKPDLVLQKLEKFDIF